MNKITIEPRIHPLWAEFMFFRAQPGISGPLSGILEKHGPIIGKWQFIYTSVKGQISLVELPNYFMDNITLWEIMSLEGNLFKDIERFHSKLEAEQQIRKYLE